MATLPDYKDIIKLIKTGATIEAQEKIMELRVAALELQEDNLRLREHIKTLENKLVFAGSMSFKKPFYYREGDAAPFCPVCWEKSNTAIHLHGPEGANEYYNCSVCKYSHYVKGRPKFNAATISKLRI